MAKKKQRKVAKYRRPRNLNVGMIMFAIILVYVFLSVSTYLRKGKVQFYEVTEGSIVSDGIYTGLTIREEDIEYAASSGNINYYTRKGKRTVVRTNICSIDESKTLSQVLADNTSANLNLVGADLVGIEKQSTSSSMAYQDRDFSSVYDVKYLLEAAVLEYVDFSTLDSLGQLIETMGVNFAQVRAPKSGVISYAIDSFEGSDTSQISEAALGRTSRSRAITKSGKLVGKRAPVYKIVTDEDWSLVFPMSEQGVADYGTQASLKIFSPAEDFTCWGDFSMLTGTGVKPYGRLGFSRYMVQFVTDRYLDFETTSGKVEELKISVSSVTGKNSYPVPVDCLTTGRDSTDNRLYKEVYSESGTGIVFVPATPYNPTEEYHYVDIDDEEGGLKAGDYTVKPDSPTECYQVGTTSSLQGVYKVNRGYTMFKQTVVLVQNNEYYTAEKGISYGPSIHDHIIMDISLIESEGVLTYQ